MNIKKIIKKCRPIYSFLKKCDDFYSCFNLYIKYSNNIKKGIRTHKCIIYYCGIPVHNNLGDLAQGMCIRLWIKKHYPNYYVTEIETNSLVNTKFSLLRKLKKVFNNLNDFIVFQSGYTTTDLGGFADLMHQEVIKSLPNARILMMPQTINFISQDRKLLCSKVYNSHKKMLFLARDKISFNLAINMFPNISVECFPDIVTTLIGNREVSTTREGIIFCLRNDSEKLYSDSELNELKFRCKKIGFVETTDTTKNEQIVKSAEKMIDFEIKKYSKYKVLITDRYHGTIFSLIAGTPVIVLRTNDHKVTTGVDWFKDIYKDYVFLAENLNHAYELAEQLYKRTHYQKLNPYFEKHYYDNLPSLFEKGVK